MDSKPAMTSKDPDPNTLLLGVGKNITRVPDDDFRAHLAQIPTTSRTGLHS